MNYKETPTETPSTVLNEYWIANISSDSHFDFRPTPSSLIPYVSEISEKDLNVVLAYKYRKANVKSKKDQDPRKSQVTNLRCMQSKTTYNRFLHSCQTVLQAFTWNRA